VRLDESLTERERAVVVRSLLEHLRDEANFTGAPRASFIRAVTGEFWNEIEREELIFIDDSITRLAVPASEAQIMALAGIREDRRSAGYIYISSRKQGCIDRLFGNGDRITGAVVQDEFVALEDFKKGPV
jgi:hypothetical protein